MLRIDIEKFAKEFKKAADYLAEHKDECGYYHWRIPNKYHKDISIVLCWSNGFNENDPHKDKYQDGSWRLTFEVGYQPDDDKREYDYDIDFNHYCSVYAPCEGSNLKGLAEAINYRVDKEIRHWKIISSDYKCYDHGDYFDWIKEELNDLPQKWAKEYDITVPEFKKYAKGGK